MQCEKCNKEHDGTFGSGKFCSRKCSNSHIQTLEQNQRRSRKLKGRLIGAALKYKGKKGRKHSEKTKEKFRLIGIERYKKGLLKKWSITNNGNKTYRKIELKYKPKIEKYFQTQNLQPQKININWFDFVNEKYIIELTTSQTNGVSNAINRFKNIINEKRNKILIAPKKYFGQKRLQQLLETGAIFIDISKLD